MEPETWGDQCVINSLSLMWSAKINIITAANFMCRETRFRAKDAPLGAVDFVLIYNGRNHYSVASKISNFLFRAITRAIFRATIRAMIRFSLFSQRQGQPVQ